MVGCFFVARRSRSGKDMLTREQLRQYQEKLASMNSFAIAEEYRKVHHWTAFEHGGAVPLPIYVQQLVQAWKALREAKRTRRSA